MQKRFTSNSVTDFSILSLLTPLRKISIGTATPSFFTKTSSFLIGEFQKNDKRFLTETNDGKI